MSTTRLIKRTELLTIVPLSKSTLYRQIEAGKFPRPIQLTGNKSVAWREDEVCDWINSRPRATAIRWGKIND